MSDFPFVCHVSSSVKKLTDVNLGRKTIIVGPTGSGKSSITDAIELALTGTVDNVGGKSTSMGVELMKLKSPESDKLVADVTIFELDGSHTYNAKYEAEGSTEKSKRPTHRIPEIVESDSLPLRRMKVAILKNQDELREMFLGIIAKDITIEDVEALLEGDALQEYNNLRIDLAKDDPDDPADGPTAFDMLGRLAEDAAKMKKDASAALKRFAEENDGPASAPPSASAISDLEAKLDEAEKRRDFFLKNLGGIEADIRSATKIEVVKTQYAVPLTGMWSVGSELMEVISTARMYGLKSCPVCKGPTYDALFESRLKEVQGKLYAVQRQKTIVTPAPRKEVPQELAARKASAEKTIAEVTQHVEGLQGSLQALREARVAYENASRSRKLRAKAEADKDRWNRVELHVREACDKLLFRGTAKVIDAVQRYLPKGKFFGVNLVAGDRRVCHIGFIDKNTGILNTAISDGERCLLLVALACALSDAKFRVVIPPDCSMDSDTLFRLLCALESAPLQVILTTTTMPRSIPAEWTLIKTGEL